MTPAGSLRVKQTGHRSALRAASIACAAIFAANCLAGTVPALSPPQPVSGLHRAARFEQELLTMRYALASVTLAALVLLGGLLALRKKIRHQVTLIRQSEQKLRLGMTAAHMGVWDLDLVTDQTWRSIEHDRIFGYESPRSDWTRSIFLEHVSLTHRDLVADAFANALLTGRLEVECQITTSRNLSRWISILGDVIYDDRGTPGRMTGIVQDITARKETEGQLKSSQEKLGFALAAGSMGLWEMDMTTGKAWTSVEHDRIYGYDQERPEWTMALFGEHVVPEDREAAVRVFNQALQGDGLVHLECRIVRADKVRRWIAADGQVYFDEQHTPLRRAGVVQDITNRKQSEEEIRRLNAELAAQVAALTEANRELEAFSYTAAHDLRAPLRHIHGFVGALREECFDKLGADGQRFLHRIGASAKTMGVLLDDLLDFSRLGRVEVRNERVDLDSMVSHIRQDLEQECQGRSVAWRVSELPPVQGDPILLHQLLFNLIANAVKYTRNRKDSLIEIGTITVTYEQTLFVRDNGAGFEMKYVDKLFHVFERLHRAEEFEGTGIGLAIVRRIAERHGGRCWAEGAAGKGATFYVSLPIAERDKKGTQDGKARVHFAGGR